MGCSNLSSVIQPGVNSVTGGPEVRLAKLVFLGPAQRCVTQALLNDCVEPGQQEVETRTLVGGLCTQGGNKVVYTACLDSVLDYYVCVSRYLAHTSHRDAAEGSEHVGLDTRRRLEHKDATSTEQIHWHLVGKRRTTETVRINSSKSKWSFLGGGTLPVSDVGYLGVDLHCEEQPEAGMRLHRVELLLQLHQPPGGEVDVLQHHPPAGQGASGR